MNKCKNCTKNCCGNKFIGLKDAFKHTNPDIFCEILLSNEEVKRIKEFGAEKYIEKKADGRYCIALNDDISCKAFKGGKCEIYPVRPDVCKLYPFYFDPFAGVLVDKNCQCYSQEDFDSLDEEGKKQIFDLLKARIKYFEKQHK